MSSESVYTLRIDLSEIVAAIKADVLGELRADTQADGWPAHMNAATASRYLDLSKAALYKLVQQHRIPHSSEGPGCRLSFARRDLDAWIAEQRHEARP